MPKNVAKNLHANRPFSVPTAGDNGPNNCFSRTDMLTGRTPCAFGSSQSMQICVDNNEAKDPLERPMDWYRAGSVLRVPKVVILSILPFWTCFWESTEFYGPRDVIGEMLTPPFAFGNYYYFDQWNTVDASAGLMPDYSFATDNPTDAAPEYDENPFWANFNPPVSEGDKHGIYNLKQSCITTSDGNSDECNIVPSYLINPCTGIGQNERFDQVIGVALNPYLPLQKLMLERFLETKRALENDLEDPIYVIIPTWMPQSLAQLRNGALTKTHEKLNPAHGGSVNKKPCDIIDALPCYNYVPVCWGPPYPDKDNPKNAQGFLTPTVPWLATVHPGFGTNVLHLYIGHACMKYSPSNSIWDWQAWPASPEGNFLGPLYFGTYLGAGLPFDKGRRAIWRDAGFDYGYEVHGAKGLYENVYKKIVDDAADLYKAEYLNYRRFRTILFTYPHPISVNWDTHAIWADQERSCEATQFFLGTEVFSDFAATYDNEDDLITDCEDSEPNPAHLKYGETHNNFPSSQSLRDAEFVFYPPIQTRVDAYYRDIDPGTASFWREVVLANGLKDYEFEELPGKMPGSFQDEGGLAEYIRYYFDRHP